jgi:hypothetical protein
MTCSSPSAGPEITIRRRIKRAGRGRKTGLPVNKVSWQQVGHVTEPGRYMFRFGWLTIAAEDLAVWQQFPDALFALVKTAAAPATDDTEEFHLGAFELRDSSPSRER